MSNGNSPSGIDGEWPSRRNTLISVASVCALAGCIGGGNGDEEQGGDDADGDSTGGINGWEITAREADAWEDLTAGIDEVTSIDDYEDPDLSDESEVIDARERFDAASEVYDQLSVEATDQLSGNLFITVRNFFRELEQLATVGSDLLGRALGEDVDSSVESLISSINGHITDASDLWDGTEEIQEGLVDRSFPDEIQ